jgi:hypothetical protein
MQLTSGQPSVAQSIVPLEEMDKPSPAVMKTPVSVQGAMGLIDTAIDCCAAAEAKVNVRINP